MLTQVTLANLFQVVAKLGNSADNLIDLIFHFALSNTHPIYEQCIINLLLSDPLVVTLQLFMLHLRAVILALQSFHFVLPSLLGLFHLRNLHIFFPQYLLNIIDDLLGVLCFLTHLCMLSSKLLSLLSQI